jgi:hypothetical protein
MMMLMRSIALEDKLNEVRNESRERITCNNSKHKVEHRTFLIPKSRN